MRFLSLLSPLLALLLLASCGHKERMAGVAEEYILRTAEHPEGLVVKAVSEPDSDFGLNYLSQHEVGSMAALMKQVTEVIMGRTNGMREFNPEDHYVIDLAERQMRAMTELRGMLYKNNEKGEWSGWKLRVDYEAKDGHGGTYRAERWLFFDKDGETILKTFELPLP